MTWGCIMIVSAGLSLMLTLSAALTPPDGCRLVAVGEEGDAVAACADGETWFVYDPDLTQDGLWTIAREEPPEITEGNDPAALRG
jgi:hypothetical protein